MALIFFASSSEELALVRLITEPVVPLPSTKKVIDFNPNNRLVILLNESLSILSEIVGR